MKASNAADPLTSLQGEILKSLRIPLAVIDNDFRYIWLNREMAWIYQTSPERIAGSICYKIFSDQAAPCHDCPVAAVQKSGRREISQKYRDFPDGVRKYGEVSAFPIFGPQKIVAAALVMVIDITDKIVVDVDRAYQTIVRLMPSLQGFLPKPPDPLITKRAAHKSGNARTTNSSLTHRETQVLRLLAKGLSNPQIAIRLAISPHTVKSHVISIFNKLGVNDRIQAAVVATRQRLVD
jgi:DNA-binding CsgD family transcriptional regulator